MKFGAFMSSAVFIGGVIACTTTQGVRITKQADIRFHCTESLDVLSPKFALIGCKLRNAGGQTATVSVSRISLSSPSEHPAVMVSSSEMNELLADYRQQQGESSQAIARLAPQGVIFASSASGGSAGDGSGIAMVVLAGASALLKSVNDGQPNISSTPEPLTDVSAAAKAGLMLDAGQERTTYVAVKYQGLLKVDAVTICLEEGGESICTQVPVELNTARARQRHS